MLTCTMIDTLPQSAYTRADVLVRTGAVRDESEEVHMSVPQADGWTRRRFLSGLTLAGTALRI